MRLTEGGHTPALVTAESLVAVICFSVLIQPVESTLCHNILPGVNKLQRGVDVTKLDLLPLQSDSFNGFRDPIIDYNCSEGKTSTINGRTYNLPNEVWTVSKLPSGWINAQVEILKRSSDVVKHMSASTGLSGLKGLFSASGSYKRMTSSFYNESRYVEQIVAYQSASRADLIPYFVLSPGRFVIYFINLRLPPTYAANPEKYFEFIRHFGTHYFSTVKFGGLLQLYLETLKTYYESKSDREVKAEASGTFFNILKAKGGYSGSTKTVDTKFTTSTNQIIRYYGGDTNLLATEGLNRWQSTVAENPWIFAGELTPISNLITDNGKRTAMEKAVQVYVDLSYLDSLYNTLRWALNKFPLSSSVINSLIGKVQQYKNAKANDHAAIMNLGEQVAAQFEIPSWFYNQVELCYVWWPDGDGGQCGGGVDRRLCAKPGKMTTYYRDDTDRRGGGCRMTWGIVLTGATKPNWFEKTQICYNWWPDGDGGQCGGGAERTLCAPVGRFTSQYRDDTDRRGGGCRMRWKLVVPTDAPVWYRNVKLCFKWYPDGDGGQCGGGVSRELCAISNSWTTAYRDDTDRRGGGCRMSWGLRVT